jgi:hypothetical protein
MTIPRIASVRGAHTDERDEKYIEVRGFKVYRALREHQEERRQDEHQEAA